MAGVAAEVRKAYSTMIFCVKRIYRCSDIGVEIGDIGSWVWKYSCMVMEVVLHVAALPRMYYTL